LGALAVGQYAGCSGVEPGAESREAERRPAELEQSAANGSSKSPARTWRAVDVGRFVGKVSHMSFA